jgi:haloalkane dehalogenase
VPENKAGWEVLKQFDKPFIENVPGCQGVEHRTISYAGHFLQHEQPGQWVQAILDITGRD